MKNQSQAIQQTPKNWQKVKMGDYANVLGGKRLPKSYSLQDKQTNHPYLRIVDMTENGLDISRLKYISDNIFNKISHYTISDKDLYISIAGTIGFVGKIPKELSGSNLTENCAKICNFSKDLDKNFLLYFLRGRLGKAEIKAGTGGSSQPKLALHRIENFQIPFPPTTQQQKIALILTAFDDKIEVNNKIAKTLEKMVQAIFKEWFVINKNDSWQEKNLGDVMEFVYGKALKDENRKSGEVLVIGSSGIVGHHNEKLVSGPGIVVGRKGTVGSIQWIDEDFYPIDTTFYIKSRFSLYYCFMLLKNQKFISGDSAVPGLNRNQAYLNIVHIPPKEMIENFDKIIKPIFDKKSYINSENQKLRLMSNLLLPKLMRGEIRV